MNRCKVHEVNEENSITYYDKVDRSIYKTSIYKLLLTLANKIVR